MPSPLLPFHVHSPGTNPTLTAFRTRELMSFSTSAAIEVGASAKSALSLLPSKRSRSHLPIGRVWCELPAA